MATPPDLLAGSATGSIYDLGYRRYGGRRLGRSHALRALFTHSLRGIFGLGRSGRAKVAPLVLGGMIALPAVVSVGFGALTGGAADELNPIRLEGYVTIVQTLLVFFVAAQAPELLVRDLRHRVLTLYFSRALERMDYVVAKYLALLAAVALVLALPQVIILLGTLFRTPSVTDGLAAVAPLAGPVIGRTVVISALLAGVGLAASAFTVRRAFAAGAIIAVFLVLSGVVTILVHRVGLDGPLALIALLDPFALMDGVSALLFGVEPTVPAIVRTDLPEWLFAATALAVALACLGLLLVRYRRIGA
ncbi:MAG TPA: ABC transporter permease subunit [Patescibacteria group bacterium]|nr:ABC transporter permease subunit [Patescibacteria group bacterium]